MRKYLIIWCLFANGSAFAGGESGGGSGGPPAMTDETVIINPKDFGLKIPVFINDRRSGRRVLNPRLSEMEISPDTMKAVINSALAKEDVYLKGENEDEYARLTAESMDFMKNKWKGTFDDGKSFTLKEKGTVTVTVPL